MGNKMNRNFEVNVKTLSSLYSNFHDFYSTFHDLQKYYIGVEFCFLTFSICSNSQRYFDVGNRCNTRR